MSIENSLRDRSELGSPLEASSTYDEESYERSFWGWTTANTAELPTAADGGLGVVTIECWKYGSEPSTERSVMETRRIVREQIPTWLEKEVPLQEGYPPSAGIKIIAVPSVSAYMRPLAEEHIYAINKAFGLPPVERHYPSMNHGACGMFKQKNNSYVFVFRRSNDMSITTTVLRYDPVTNITYGYLYLNLSATTMKMLEMLPSQFVECSHPLLIPQTMYELTLQFTNSQLSDCDKGLANIEAKTGFGVRKATPEQIDYQVLVRTLGEKQSWMLYSKATLLAVKFSFNFICQKLRSLNEDLAREYRERLETPAAVLNERAEYILSSLEHAEAYGGLEQRMQSQQTVLFNLIAQSDNQINIGLAKDSKELAAASKQDSSAMKIIAVLTTLFLPGTFLATFFAMPLFNWSAESITHVATPHFWIYWAVTAPVTFATMIGVISWAIWHGRQTRLLHLRARGSVGPAESHMKVDST